MQDFLPQIFDLLKEVALCSGPAFPVPLGFLLVWGAELCRISCDAPPASFGPESSASFWAESSPQVLRQNLLFKFSDIIFRNSLRKFSEILVQKLSGIILRNPSVFGM